MMLFRRIVPTAALGLLVLAMPACKKKDAPAPASDAASPATAPAQQEFAVETIEIGKAVGADKRVTSTGTSFGRRDTIYVSVATEGVAPSKTIAAKWTFEDGQVVEEASKSIAPNGPEVTEFHISKPSRWPAGKYKVEIAVDGAAAGSKDFEIK